jgi:CheY-like chemotaxis protein
MADVPGILIVDDNEDNRYTLHLLLESDGHERIASASGGTEAIALLEKQKFSLVLLDLMMPDLNGDEVLKLIKSDPDKRDIPVVMISADTDAEKVAQCIELGADDYLSKPSIRRSCAPGSARRCADTRYGRWKTSIWARSRTRSAILRISCATFCRLKS